MSEQMGFDFGKAPEPAKALDEWRAERHSQIEVLARRSGLPIGHEVRVQLVSGVLLEGRLLPAEDDLWPDRRRSVQLRLQIGRADFLTAEIESCVRTD